MLHGHGAAPSTRWDGASQHRPGRPQKAALIDRAYRQAEAGGLPLYCQDEAGPYQAVPQPGPSWQPGGCPRRRPHEYLRGGTAKLLTLFRPTTGHVRADTVRGAPNRVLHPWLQRELSAVLATLPAPPPKPPVGQRWADWADALDLLNWPALGLDRTQLPPLRLLLVWDNLRGPHTPTLVRWCLEQGILPLYTPIAGSWLNLAEAVQRILVRRALAGQHPTDAHELMDWLAATVRGWNADPTPFGWAGKRAARRRRAHQRRHPLGGSAGYTRRPLHRSLCRRLPNLLHQ